MQLRFLIILSLLVPSGALGVVLPPDGREQVVPDRHFDIEKLVLDLDLTSAFPSFILKRLLNSVQPKVELCKSWRIGL